MRNDPSDQNKAPVQLIATEVTNVVISTGGSALVRENSESEDSRIDTLIDVFSKE